MNNLKYFTLAILVAVVFGTVLSYRAQVQFGWQRVVIAALAFSVLGLLINYVNARRKH